MAFVIGFTVVFAELQCRNSTTACPQTKTPFVPPEILDNFKFFVNTLGSAV